MSDDAANSADSGTGSGTGVGTGGPAAGAQVPDAEDRKIITLARSARARNGVPEGAAVRDETGRTYVAGSVELDSLKLSALRTAVAMAVASGAQSLEAAAVVSAAGEVPDEDRAAVKDLGGAGTPVLLAGPDGTLRTTVTAG
ncbi:cytidine deaminase [Streptomyces sp. NBC_00963]|uniref:cytidine deaminase n=1 Tax=Streptomyces sp. NBC_00963 TaxID=2903697 RepID=UPI0038679C28|nr:cytidine deaminase [Streptomyces sp. NBC_00963]